MAASAIAAVSAAGTVSAANIRIIGTDESEVETQAQDPAAENTQEAAADSAEGTSQTEVQQAGSEGQDDAAEDTQTENTAAANGSILNPSEENITSSDAVSNARTLYSQMQHYADINDYSSFASLFEPGADSQTIQDQLQSVKSSLSDVGNLTQHADLCFYDPTEDTTQSPYYFAVALCDYDVDVSGAVSWYSTLMRVAKYEDGWKVSLSPAGDLLELKYPAEYTASSAAGYNAVDLYPSLGMRFASGAVFNGALYALPNLLWQGKDGELYVSVWIANGTSTSKWCDTIDLIVQDGEVGDVTKVNVPVQTALQAGESALVTCSIPAEYIDSGTKEWTQISVNSNLKYQ